MAGDLNYDNYHTDKYDSDIINAIPYHKELHEYLISYVKNNFKDNKEIRILDLGVGTGITTKMIQDVLPSAILDVVDFSEQMLDGAKKKLGEFNVNYILADYSTLDLENKYDIIVSVIGIHHQNHEGKKKLFKKIYGLLKNNGVFLFGDLMTYKNDIEASTNHALHYHHMVEKAKDKKTLGEWAHHHIYLNDLAPYEDQTERLKEEGFTVKKEFLKMNTGLLVCKK